MADAVPGVIPAPITIRNRHSVLPRPLRLAFLAWLLALSVMAIEMPAAPHANAYSVTEAARIVRYAASHIGARFRLGAEGPRVFDCSGLIYYVYRQAGVLNRIGGTRRTAAGYYRWFKQRGLASRSNGRVGDLVIWTENGRIAHSGIYVGDGHVISALINPWGVSRTHINTIHARFLAFLHVRLTR